MMKQESVFKFLYRLDIGLISLFSISFLFGRIFPFEFADSWFGFQYDIAIGSCIPVLVLLLLIRLGQPSFRQKRNRAFIWETILAAILCIPFVIIVLISSGMCGMMTDEIIFRQKEHPKRIIAKRHYDCGAVDSSKPKYKVYKIIPLTSMINFVTQADTSDVDMEVWERVIQ